MKAGGMGKRGGGRRARVRSRAGYRGEPLCLPASRDVPLAFNLGAKL